VKRTIAFESGLYSAKTAAYMTSARGVDWTIIDTKARTFIKSRAIAGAPEVNTVEEDFRACLMSDDEGIYRLSYLEHSALIQPTDDA
jgi:hypothetical protein